MSADNIRTAICIASGCSLTKDDVEYVRLNRNGARVYVVNNCYQIAPWADVLYACDGRWWHHYIDDVQAKFTGDKWTIDTAAACSYNLKMPGVALNQQFSNTRDVIATGGNSGFQALNLAVVQGAQRVLLLGYDMKIGENGVRHWHGNHPRTLLQTAPNEYKNWIESYRLAKKHIAIPVINCTRDTALDCFPKMALEEALPPCA